MLNLIKELAVFRTLIITLMMGLFSFASAWGEEVSEWQVGKSISAFDVSDQNDVKNSINDKIKLLIVARDMAASKLVAATLESTPQSKLNEKGIAYLADVSGMPGLVFKFAALPKMRKLSYSILLDREGTLTNGVPFKEKQVTLLGLEKGKITFINYYSSPQELRKALSF
ncbi:MAG: hypothetical protein RJB66_1584 [Pseudomonadota bacterium]|jgi:hypothetical protein